MANRASVFVPPPGSRTLFTWAAVVAAVLVLGLLLVLPRGDAATGPTAGAEVGAELVDGVSIQIVPELRDQGWRAGLLNSPYSLDLHVTVVNDSDDLFPRWYRLEVRERSGGESDDLYERLTGSLQTAHVPPGEQASTDFSYHYSQACGQFVVTIDFSLDMENGRDPQTVDVPFVVGDEQCLAELDS